VSCGVECLEPRCMSLLLRRCFCMCAAAEEAWSRGRSKWGRRTGGAETGVRVLYIGCFLEGRGVACSTVLVTMDR
jgi:coproporphyrinogen III oxidase